MQLRCFLTSFDASLIPTMKILMLKTFEVNRSVLSQHCSAKMHPLPICVRQFDTVF